MNIIELNPAQMLGKKPFITPRPNSWIAGGAIRQWFKGDEKETDIDIFCSSLDVVDSYIDDFVKAKILDEKPHATTLSYEEKIIQLITYSFYKDINELFDSFDFALCQFAWDGQKIYSTGDAIISVLRNHLQVHKLGNNVPDSLRRAFKYQRKGYTPCLGTIRDLGQGFTKLTNEQIENQIVISPGGGKRFVGVD